MANTKAASRYAKSLLLLAIEQNVLNSAYEDMKLIDEACENSKDLDLLLKSPVVNTAKKLSILKAVFDGKISKLSMAFLNIITKKKRENLLSSIASSFVKLYKKHNSIITAEVFTAVEMESDIKDQVKSILAELDSNKVEIVSKVDEDLIGGIKLRIGDRQIDSSVQARLNQLKKNFSKNPYIVEI